MQHSVPAGSHPGGSVVQGGHPPLGHGDAQSGHSQSTSHGGHPPAGHGHAAPHGFGGQFGKNDPGTHGHGSGGGVHGGHDPSSHCCGHGVHGGFGHSGGGSEIVGGKTDTGCDCPDTYNAHSS